jgi:hypothetical protein
MDTKSTATCNGQHNLEIITRTSNGTPGVTNVTRWCSTCGAIVIDTDVDGRTHPGNVMRMRFPSIAVAQVPV